MIDLSPSIVASMITGAQVDLYELKRCAPFDSTAVSSGSTRAARDASAYLPQVPRFASGGIVPGIDMGRDSVLSYLRPGELVIPKAQFETPALIPRAILQRLSANMPQSPASRSEPNDNRVDNSRSVTVHQQNTFTGRVDPWEQERALNLMREKLIADFGI